MIERCTADRIAPPAGSGTGGRRPLANPGQRADHRQLFDTGDDGVAVKADAGGAASHITVRNTSFWGIHGLSVGSQTNGGVQDVTFSGNYIRDGTDIHGNTASSDNGVRVKSDTSFGGTVCGVSFLNTCETGSSA